MPNILFILLYLVLLCVLARVFWVSGYKTGQRYTNTGWRRWVDQVTRRPEFTLEVIREMGGMPDRNCVPYTPKDEPRTHDHLSH